MPVPDGEKRAVFRVVPQGRLSRLADHALHPLMRLLGGGRADSVQETHFWHCQAIDPLLLDPALTVVVQGDDASRVRTNGLWPLPLFHAPILGGWRNYIVLEAEGAADCGWHVGWVHRSAPPGARPRRHVNRLLLSAPRVRVLKQAQGFVTEFFAIGADGRQLALRVAGEGKLGDMGFAGLRLL